MAGDEFADYITVSRSVNLRPSKLEAKVICSPNNLKLRC